MQPDAQRWLLQFNRYVSLAQVEETLFTRWWTDLEDLKARLSPVLTSSAPLSRVTFWSADQTRLVRFDPPIDHQPFRFQRIRFARFEEPDVRRFRQSADEGE